MNQDKKAEKFWNRQLTSLHRYSDDEYFKNKASEIKRIIDANGSEYTFTDCGCGGGELLLQMLNQDINVLVAFDFSESLITQAHKILHNKKVKLVTGTWQEVLPYEVTHAWITSGALNQYLSPNSMEDFLNCYLDNTSVQILYLVDCVDPLRWLTLNLGGRYDARYRNNLLRRVYYLNKSVWRLIAFALSNKSAFSMRDPRLGYGFFPRFWRDFAEKSHCDIKIVSSEFYEYRYHVILKKNHFQERI